MANVIQHRSSWTSLRPVASALAAAMVLLFAVTPARSQENERPKRSIFTVLYSFTGGADGSEYSSTYAPFDKDLMRDAEGNLYGTGPYGGDLNACFAFGCGVVFKLDSAGNESVLYRFAGGTDGNLPLSGLIQDKKGNLYGTTASGGTYQAGTVFRVDHTGKETILYNFTGGGDDQGFPHTGVIADEEGNLYGTTSFGGPGFGTVFKLEPSGKEIPLYTFSGGSDGSLPTAGLIRDDKGNLYGTTLEGGSGVGVVFKLDPSGKETVLYTFTGGADGARPAVGLVRDQEGNLYGTATLGGLIGSTCGGFGCGVVFKVDPAGKETILYTFTGLDGSGPATRLVRDAKGNLYGTTAFGGEYGPGVVFELDHAGTEHVLYNFTGGADGWNPDTGLVRDDEGNLYGSTEFGGTFGVGVIYKLKPPED